MGRSSLLVNVIFYQNDVFLRRCCCKSNTYMIGSGFIRRFDVEL